MKHSARIQTTIEVWDLLSQTSLPMDKFCGDYFRSRRYIGSKDRKDIAARLYGMMRHYARLGWWLDMARAESTPRLFVAAYLYLSGEYPSLAQISDLYCGEKHSPAALSDGETKALKTIADQAPKSTEQMFHADMPLHIFYEAPKQAYDDLAKAYGEEKTQQILGAMRENALLHLRVNTRHATADQVLDALKAEEISAQKGAFLDHALRLENTVQLSKTKPFQKAWIEIQDEGSQAIAALCAVKPGMQVLDYCAGGGGKTLALADMMDGKGRIVAMDNNTQRLMRGKKRYTRADIHNVELRSLEEDKHRKWLRRQKDKFDVVLIDAPCSGSGTWRRNPDLRWRGVQPDLQETLETQRQILDKAAQYVKQGGTLVYATCSLLPQENEGQIETFLAEHSDFKIDDAYAFLPKLQNPSQDQASEIQSKSMRLNPHDHGTDGFFACRLIKA